MPYVTSIERIGMEKGLAQGRQEGRQEGQREERLEAIRLLLELRFGPQGLELMQAIQPLTDLLVLQKVRDSIKTAATLEEVRNAWQS